MALILTCLCAACGATAAPPPARPAAGVTSAQPRGAAAPSQGAPVHVTVAYGSPSAAFMPLFVAQHQGLFARYGLSVTIELLRTSAAQDAALTQNQVQFNLAGIPEINAIRKGLPVVFLASWLNTVVANIMAAPRYHSIKALLSDPRAVIAANAPPALLNLCWRMVFQSYHVDMSRMHLLNVNAIPAMVATLRANKASAICITEPTVTILKQAGFRDLLQLSTLKIPMLTWGVTVDRSWLAGHRGVATRFIEALAAAVHDLQQHAAVGKSAIAQQLKIHDPQALSSAYSAYAAQYIQIPRFPPASVGEYDKLMGVAARGSGTQRYADDSIVNHLVQTGFFKKLYGG